MRKLKIDCQVEVGKIVEIMIAKESESSVEIAKLKAEVEKLRKGKKKNSRYSENRKQDKKYHVDTLIRQSSTSSLSGSETRLVRPENASMSSLQMALLQSNVGADSVTTAKMSSLAIAAMRRTQE
jgi:hypothetical protein